MCWKDTFPDTNIYFQTENGILYCGDCIEIMENFPEESVDLVLTDPPYKVEPTGIKNGTGCRNDYFKPDILGRQLFSILRDNTRFYLFIAQITLCETIIQMSSYFPLHQILVWHKPNFAGGGKRVFDFTSCYEFILLFHKGNPSKLNNPRRVNEIYLSNCDVLRYTQPQSNFKKDKRFHAHQKPLKLIEHLVIASTQDKDLVLDPFIGSGTTAVACERLNRRWVGIEISPQHCEIAKRRILN